MLICLSTFGPFECQRDFRIRVYGEDEEKLISSNTVKPIVKPSESAELEVEPSTVAQLTKEDEISITTELPRETGLGYFAENSSSIFDDFEFVYDYEPSSNNLVTYNNTSQSNKSSFDFELMLHWFIGVILTSIMVLLLTTLLLCCIKLAKSCAGLITIDLI